MHVVIVGGSDAGISAALRARELDPGSEVTVVVADSYPNYSICGIPYYVSGEVPLEGDLAHRSRADLERAGLSLRLESRATQIDVSGRRLRLRDAAGDESSIDYDELVVGTGATSARPPIEGLTGDQPLGVADGVHLLHTMGDTADLVATLEGSRSALIVGAGYVGLEMAEGLTTRGISVTQVEALPEVLPTVDPELGALVRAELVAHGVQVHTSTTITRLSRGEHARLRVDGTGPQGQELSWDVDLVLVVVGVRPDTALLVDAGARTGAAGAVVVDESMATGLPRVWAAGDCVATDHRLLGSTYLPLGTTAHKQGRVAPLRTRPAHPPPSGAAMNARDTDRRLVLLGPRTSADAYELRDFLSRSIVEYESVDVDDARGAAAVREHPEWADRWPVCRLPDGTVITEATVAKVAHHLGWVSAPREREYDLSIYGAGPAGLSAAVYGASEGLSVALVERHAVGGQAGWTTRIENYLGSPGGISGADLAERARQQAVEFGADLLQIREGVRAVFPEGRIVVDLADGGTLTARSNICATGVEYRRLHLDREDAFLNAGVYYGAGLSETAACADREVIIVGGGNSAGQAALHLSATSRHVHLLVRGEGPAASMSDYLLRRLEASDRITIHTSSAIRELVGDTRLEAVVVRDSAGGTDQSVSTQHVFVLIGGVPNTDWAAGTDIVRDPTGYLVTGPDLLVDGQPPATWPLRRLPALLETSVPGSFAVGDVRHASTKRVASAVGEGAMAVHLVHRWLAEAH